MALGIKKHTLSFDILDSDDVNTMVFIDLSDYYEQPEKPLLEVTLPGYNKYFLVNIQARKINMLNSNTIGLSETLSSTDLAALPDGVYKLKYKVCPYDKVYTQKFHLRTTSLENSLATIFNLFESCACDVEQDDAVQRNITDVLVGLEAAKANAKHGDYKKASDLYKRVSSKVTSLLNKLEGVC